MVKSFSVIAALAERLRTRWGVALVLVFVALVALGVYLPSVRYGFVGADRELLLNNPAITTGAPAGLFTRGYRSGSDEVEIFGSVDEAAGFPTDYFRPLTMMTFWLDARISGLKPWYFHLVNVFLHAGAAVFVALTVWELLHSGVWAGFAGLLFALHPAQVETVGFIAGRADLLVAVFAGFAGFALLRSLRKKNWRWWLVVPVCFAMALLSKESAIVFPLLALGTPTLTQNRFPRRYWLLIFILVIILGGYLYWRAVIFGWVLPVPTSAGVINLFNVVNTLGFYIYKFLWPFTHRIKIPPDPSFSRLMPFTIYATVFLFGVPLAGWRPRLRVVLWAYCWAVLFLLPVSNIVPLGVQAKEGLLFLPAIGLVAVMVIFISRLLVMHNTARLVVGFCLLVLAGIWGWNTSRRLPVCRDDVAFFSTLVEEAPDLADGYAGLAGALREVMPDSAIKLYKRALLIDQGLVPSHISIATLYRQQGDYRRAIHHLRLADELLPEHPGIATELGLTFLCTGQLDSARSAFTRALGYNSEWLTVPTPARYGPRIGLGLTAGLMGDRGTLDTLFLPLAGYYPEWQDSVRLMARRIKGVFEKLGMDATYIRRLDSLLLYLGDSAGFKEPQG